MIRAALFEIALTTAFVLLLLALGAPIWGAVGLGFLTGQVVVAEANRA